jgi:hypothetical protein
MKTKNYKIVRFYKSGYKKTIRKNLTLADAKQWCNRSDTEKAGVWFDGFVQQ